MIADIPEIIIDKAEFDTQHISIHNIIYEASISDGFTISLHIVVPVKKITEKIIFTNMHIKINKKLFVGVVVSCKNITPTLFNKNYELWNFTLQSSFQCLSYTQKCRVFLDKTIIDIVGEILTEHKINFLTHTPATQPKKFCAQYNETDENFIKRLLWTEGYNILWSYDNEEKMHIVTSEKNATSLKKPSIILKKFWDGFVENDESSNVSDIGTVYWSDCPEHEATPLHYSMNCYDDYDKNIMQANPASKNTEKTWHTYIPYPDSSVDLSKYKERHDKTYKEENNKQCIQIVTRGIFYVGDPVQLKSQDEIINTYIIRIHTHYDQNKGFISTLTLTLDKIPYLFSHKNLNIPKIHGVQLAEIAPDPNDATKSLMNDQGFVKILLPWSLCNHKEKKMQLSGWVRIVTPYAGQQQGFFFYPKPHQEVIINFIDGNPDDLIIVGFVSNPKNENPMKFNSTVFEHTLKTQFVTHQAETDYNELRFIDNTSDNKQGIVFFTGGSMTTCIEHNDTKVLTEGDTDILLKKGNYKMNLEEGDAHTILKKGDYTVDLDSGNINIETKSGNIVIKSSGEIFISSSNISIKATGNLNLEGSNVMIKANGALSLSGVQTEIKGQMLELKAAATCKISAPLMDIQASGPLALKGAIIQLN